MEGLHNGGLRQAGSYVNGPSLAAAVAAHGPLPVRSVLTLAAGLAEALSAAHAAGVIHHNLNPASVLLTADGPRLIDFGGPRAAGPGPGARGDALDFTSPEQAAVLVAGPASDIFSLGTVLLYAASGNLMSYFAWHPDQLPGELRPLIERCMAADPARRPTAAELRTELTAARPDAASGAAWLPPGILIAGTAPSGGWPAQSGTAVPYGTVAPAPYGTVAPAPYGTVAPAPYGTVAPARYGIVAPAPYGIVAPAPPFPAGTVTAGPRRRPSPAAARIRRQAGIIAIAALAFVVATAGVVYVIHPWSYPVLRPAGLTVDQRGTNSISVGWSNPASGPLPDKYVILRNGAVAATVPGNVDHFKDGGLAPATTYDFRVIAYRGRVSSQTSLDLRAATRTPPLSEAVFNVDFQVVEKIREGGSSVTGDADGDTWYDHWTFSSNCALGPCVTHLSGAIDNGEPFSAVLKPDGTGDYTGSVPINDFYYCGDSETNYTHSTLQISVRALAGWPAGTQWQATKLTGRVTWEIDANTNGNCGGATLVIGIAG